MAVPESKPSPSGKILSAWDRDSSADASGSSGSESASLAGDLLAGELNQSTALSSLKDLVAAGDQRLDPMLAAIIDASRQLTNASGAALAMWKDGAMVCRARSGDTAPALGARLSADTGISGECLRTGKIQHCADTENDPLVDLEVCRSLGLRSIAVLPIQGWRGINGILEVFSTAPAAFSEQHIDLLQQLAALAERARAAQPHGASSSSGPSAVRKSSSVIEKPQPSGLLPASDPVADVALAFLGTRLRPFALGGIGIVAVSLLALVIWLGWRGPGDSDGRVLADSVTFNTSTANALTAHPPDNDPVWKPNPGGEPLFRFNRKPSAGAPVKFASKVDLLAGKKAQANQSPVTPSKENALAEAPSLSGFSPPVSAGVSGGQLVHHVEPVYPAEARLLRQEGTVALAAVVMEDGSVRDVKVVDGPPVFAQSAIDAVKYWRYKPFELDGKPVKKQIEISVEFNLP